ncbi:MAG: pyridoxal phosphate-dependent aminotransferase [Candidatus Methanomethylicia archaeon]
MLYEIFERVLALEASGRKIIKMNVGEPPEDIHPEILECMVKAIRDGKVKYTSSKGMVKLRRELAAIHGVDEDNIVITPGSKWGIYASIRVILRNNDGNVMVFAPFWPAYSLMVTDIGKYLKVVDLKFSGNNWILDFNRLTENIGNVKLLILNSPNNPTSTMIKYDELKKLVKLLDEFNITAISDEAYIDLSFIEAKSLIDLTSECIVVRSFSKLFSMTGLRIGYVIASKEVASAIANYNSATITCVPEFIQEAALKALELRNEIAKYMVDKYRVRAEIAYKILTEAGFKVAKPEAGFYIFPKINIDSNAFFLKLLESEGIAVTPGSAFGNFNDFIRISLTVDNQFLTNSLNRLVRCYEYFK